MKLQEFNPEDLVFNKAIAARKGEPREEDVKRMCINFSDRIERGLDHQIQPGVVRIVDGKPEVVVGRHRAYACKMYNEAKGPNDEPLMFVALLVKANDENDLITAIMENEYKTATTVIDRADSMQKLADLGKAQKEIATIFGMSEGTVSQMLKCATLEKKYQKAILDGDLESDAAILIAGLPVGDDKRQEIFEECIRHRNRFDEIQARLENKKVRADAESEVTTARTKAEEIELQHKDVKSKLKEAETAVKEIAKTVTKATDTKELEAARRVQDDALAKRKQFEEEAKRLEKEKEKAVKTLDKAKQNLEKVREQTKAAKTKVTPEDVKKVAKEKGVSSKKTDKPVPVTKNQFVVALEALTENKKRFPEGCGAVVLIGRIEAYLDGELTDTQLANAFANCCVDVVPTTKGKTKDAA